ncbi:S-layer homology domain-containing protein [Paenibacillus sp. sgz302251]|uniref:S-layer homology domain-containing protein n=1 Tax=Paenibacillus sp. sgz302251 TaxID=3414493 RepID=UPI003C7DD8E5
MFKIRNNLLLQELSAFDDRETVAEWAKESLALAVHSGLVEGNGASIKPLDRITRAEIAVMLQRMFMNQQFINGVENE